MELCRVLIEGLDLPSKGKAAAEVKTKIEPAIKDVVGDAQYHIVHSATGDLKDQLLIVFSNKNFKGCL